MNYTNEEQMLKQLEAINKREKQKDIIGGIIALPFLIVALFIGGAILSAL